MVGLFSGPLQVKNSKEQRACVEAPARADLRGGSRVISLNSLDIHTYTHTYDIHTHLPTYLPTYVHVCMHACMHAYRHTRTHTYIHTYIQSMSTYRIQDARSLDLRSTVRLMIRLHFAVVNSVGGMHQQRY